MVNNINSSLKPIEQKYTIIHDYLYQYAADRSSQLLIKEFRQLFIQGKNKNIEVSQALEKVIFTTTQQEFDTFFSQCFYLTLDCWLEHPDSLSYLSELFKVLEDINRVNSYDRYRKQLIKSIENYQQSKTYFQLQAILAIINPQENARVVSKVVTNEAVHNSHINTTVNAYLARYTYLYQYLSTQNLECKRLNKTIKSLQSDRQKDFEFKLSQHIIYRFRLKQLARMKLLSKAGDKVITRVDNPCLLSEKAFKIALQQYLGKIDNKQTLQERSQRFIAQNKLRNSYQIFKQDLYKFLTRNIQPRNNYKFDRQLQDKLEQIFPQSNNKLLNDTLILQTSRQLFSFMIIDTSSPTDTQRFVEIITNLGTAQMIMVLIKITLICPQSKADLEKKIALIVTHYQMHNIQDVPWLIKSLEHLLIAFSIYFGNIDVSIARLAISKT